MLQRFLIIFEHGLIKRTFNQITDVVSVFGDYRFHVVFVNRAKNNAKRNKKKKGGKGGNKYDTPVN
jgi:hypothetical protein